MKKSLIVSFAAWSLFQLLTPSCKKSIEPPINPVDTVAVIDTIVPVDTTVVVEPDSTANYRIIQVNNIFTGQPATNCTVALYYSYHAPFCSDLSWAVDSVLGTTDENGRLIWKWDGTPLPFPLVISASFIHNGFVQDGQTIDKIPPKHITLIHKTSSFVKLHIDYQLDTLPNSKIRLSSITPSTNCYGPSESPILQLSAPHPFDTTIVLTNYVALTYEYKIKYLVDVSSYQTSISTGRSKNFYVTFPASDTAEVNIVIK